MSPDTLPPNLTKRIDQTEDCWLWTGPRDEDGYGRAYHSPGKQRRAHRLVYARLTGTDLTGLTLHHTCRVRRCVNPSHLEPMSRPEHTRLEKTGGPGWNIGIRQPRCRHGHAFDEANTYAMPNGKRYCRACNRRNVAASKQRRRERQS